MKTHVSFLLLVILTIGRPVMATNATHDNDNDDGPMSLFTHLQGQDVLNVTLTLNLTEVLDNRKTNDYFPATFSYTNVKGQALSWDIKLRNRGRYRRSKCDMPPLKLKFPKKLMKADGFSGHNDFKLVTHCLDSDKDGENVLREYLAYQLYAQLSPVNFRTQLVRITYINTQTGSTDTNYGILIEDSDEMAERMQSTICEECFNLDKDKFDRSNIQTSVLFQYMIGNTDYSVTMSRNLKILVPVNSNDSYRVAAYDFDFSGLVNTEYARPRNEIGQRSVRQRVYLGANWEKCDWTATMQHFQAQRTNIMDTIDGFEYLSKRDRRDIKSYINEFYEELDAGLVPQNTQIFR